MAPSSSMLSLGVLATLLAGVSCKLPNVPPGPDIPPVYGNNWLVAKATWYGAPTGAGGADNGGGCGYKDVDKPPFSAKTSCGNPPIFKDGKGCGSCYEIKCSKPEACSGQPVMIRIADQNEEPISAYHFDLTGTAFGALAKPGLEQQLRSAGELELEFRRVKCTYPPGTKVTFHVETGSNPNYLALLVKYIPVDGNAVAVEIKQKGESEWIPLKPSWGAIWRIDTPKILTGPFSVRYTTEGGTKTVAEDIIPAGWSGGSTYTSTIDSNSGAGGVSDDSPAAESGPTPGTESSSGPGPIPDAGSGSVPEAGPGSVPDAGPGLVPDAGPGSGLGGEPGSVLDGGPGFFPGGEPGSVPDGRPGFFPGGEPGSVPDGGPGVTPGTESGGESSPAAGSDIGPINIGPTMAGFRLEKGSTPTNLIVTAKYAGNDDFDDMQVKGQGSRVWVQLNNAGGSTWKGVSPTPLKAPLAIRFETKKGMMNVDDNAIPSF